MEILLPGARVHDDKETKWRTAKLKEPLGLLHQLLPTSLSLVTCCYVLSAVQSSCVSDLDHTLTCPTFTNPTGSSSILRLREFKVSL